jgi:hypothetical protein
MLVPFIFQSLSKLKNSLQKQFFLIIIIIKVLFKLSDQPFFLHLLAMFLFPMHNKYKEKFMELHVDDDLGVHNKYLAIAIHVAIKLVVV